MVVYANIDYLFNAHSELMVNDISPLILNLSCTERETVRFSFVAIAKSAYKNVTFTVVKLFGINILLLSIDDDDGCALS